MLKKLTSLQNKTFFKFWIFFHALVILGFCAMLYVKKGINIDADLFNMLPKPEMGKALNAADEKLTEVTGQNVFILVSNPDFGKAKQVAENVYGQLNGSPRFKSLSLYQNTDSFGKIVEYINNYKYNLIDSETIDELNSEGGAEAFAQDALSKAYGAFTVTSLENLESDPFMLGEHNLLSFLKQLQESGTKMSLKDEVLASEVNGRWYVMIRGILSKEGAALASKENAVVQIHQVCDPLEDSETKFIYSGTPFHSYKSSSDATKEISTISTISMTAVLVILLLIFQRPSPILFSIGSILWSSLMAIFATLAIFGKMHILTLVFGTSLIGSCIDYSLHYFINWKGNLACHKGYQVRNHLIKGLSLSLVSTVICYFILVFAPFNLLKQMAVFSMSGIISSFLTVICVYPFIKVPQTKREIKLLKYYTMPSWYNKKFVGRIAITIMFVFSISVLLIFHKNVKIENNLSRLYKMEGREMLNEKEAAQVLQYSPSGWYIVSGSTAEETLQNEEKITAELKKMNAGKEKGGFVCTTSYIPSISMQKKSREAAAKLLPLAAQQYEYLGYDSSYAKKLAEDFKAGENDFIEIGKNVPEYLASAISSAWLGEIDGKYYSVVLPVSVLDYDAYKSLADGENVFFISKVRSMNADLDRLSDMILKLFVVVYIALFIILRFFYSLKQTAKIVSVPLLIVLMTSSIFALCGIHFEFFSITGMILVFGLGLDYVIYMIENEKRTGEVEVQSSNLEPFAIALSFVTSAVSFGALALSKFVPVHMIGLSIFIGLTTAFVSTFFYTRADF